VVEFSLMFVCLSVCLHDISKTYAARITELTHKCSTMSPGNIFTFIHQNAGSNNRRKSIKDKRTKKSNTKTQEHGAKSTQSATNWPNPFLGQKVNGQGHESQKTSQA